MCRTFGTQESFLKRSNYPAGHCYLLSGSFTFIQQVLGRLSDQSTPVVACVELVFSKIRPRDLIRWREKNAGALTSSGFYCVEVKHADFGGATNASHLLFVRGLPRESFLPPACTPRVIKHLINSASQGFFQSIEAPPSLQGSVERTPIVVGDLLRVEGLFDVHKPTKPLACPSVFSTTRWVRRTLTKGELLRTFDIPVSMDCKLKQFPHDIRDALSSMTVSTIFRALWGVLGGVEEKMRPVHAVDKSHNACRTLPSNTIEGEESTDDDSIPALRLKEGDSSCSSTSSDASEEVSMPSLHTKDFESSCSSDSERWPSNYDDEAGIRGSSMEIDSLSLIEGESLDLARLRPEVTIEFDHIPELSEGIRPPLAHFNKIEEERKDTSSIIDHLESATLGCINSRVSDRGSSMSKAAMSGKLDRIKQEHDNAKAVKADDAGVPIHLWDEVVCRGKPTEEQVRALVGLRKLALHRYRRSLFKDCIKYLRKSHGVKWFAQERRRGQRLDLDITAVQDLVTRGMGNDWFEYPAGSRLKFFRFPSKYRQMARDGVPVYFTGPAPTAKRAQPPMKEAEREVLRNKLLKVIRKGYMSVPTEELKSLIYYFGVPKGSDDWRVVYHAGANGLNDCVWAPSFWLPKLDSLLRIVDIDSVMEDRDIGEMFLNFELALAIRKYTGVDLGPLGLTSKECSSQWVYWTRNLMGFKPSPHNSIRMYLISEEIIRGDPEDSSNPFQWDHIKLNLPGTKGYTPNESWLSKRRSDKSLASDFVCFVDDQRLGAAGSKRMREAGHALSTREAYLGIQDALRKLRAAGGTKWPGAWAGTVVFIMTEEGVVVLTSQEKWDRLKQICEKWLLQLQAGETELDHKELLSDRGFLVYVTGAYPAMVPYLKGFHLSIEMWRGGRDAEGWKLKPTKEEDVLDEEEEDAMDPLEDEEILPEETTRIPPPNGPSSGTTSAVPRLRTDLEALLSLADSEKPAQRIVRSKNVLTAFYGFGDASSGGFGASIERTQGIHGRYGLWGRDEESDSSNCRELKNLVETVEEEAAQGHLKNTELWLFTDNSTAESCFIKGSSTSKILHELVLRLRKVEMSAGFTLHIVHVAGTRMIAQGTDGLSRGVLLEGVLAGKDMLDYVDIAKTALDRCPALLEYIQDFTGRPNLKPLSVKDWFFRGHGIVGGDKDDNGIWIPTHAKNGQTYLWSPPPVIAEIALEECLKAVHKRRDAYHVFVIPRLCNPRWTRLFHKLCDFIVKFPAGSSVWPSDMHEPLWLGISLPFIQHRPWSIRGTPLLVELDRDMRRVLGSGEGDGRDILRQLLRVPGRIASLPILRARGVLHLPAT